jgi:hypothetical protein
MKEKRAMVVRGDMARPLNLGAADDAQIPGSLGGPTGRGIKLLIVPAMCS